MSLRQRIWAAKIRVQLEAQLGGVCWACGSTGPLHFDHPNGRDWSVRKTEFSARICRYRREIAEGTVRLLCEACNSGRQYDGVELPHPGERVAQINDNEPF